jgi:hypothetical protein
MAGSNRMKRLRQAQQAASIKAESDKVVAERDALLKQRLAVEREILQKREVEHAKELSVARREQELRKTPLGRAQVLISKSELGKVSPITVRPDTQRPGNIFIWVQQESGGLSYTYNPHTGDIRGNERIMLNRPHYEETRQILRKILSQ